VTDRWGEKRQFILRPETNLLFHVLLRLSFSFPPSSPRAPSCTVNIIKLLQTTRTSISSTLFVYHGTKCSKFQMHIFRYLRRVGKRLEKKGSKTGSPNAAGASSLKLQNPSTPKPRHCKSSLKSNPQKFIRK
jgi:hypothetical protein